MRRALLLLVALVVLQVPWLTRPVHYDEANFLMLAHGAAADPWRPHDVRINWQGTEERAFDVLSNPPGIAWWLAPVLKQPVAVQRAWMLAWLPLALFGAWKLGRRFVGDGGTGALLLLGSPIAFLSTPALLPDAPLYALTLAGVGGYLDAQDRGRSGIGWAFLAGCAALFRYSALPLAPLLVLWSLWRGRPPWAALAAFVPLGLLALHDLSAYGTVHLFAMGKFQSVSNTAEDLFHKGVASLAMLGGAAVLPIFPWSPAARVGAVVGALGGVAWGWEGALFAAMGGAVLGHTASNRERPWLAVWAFGGLLFLLTLRFTATRYWLPFLPAIALSLPTKGWRWRAGVQMGLAMLLAADELQSARAQQELAEQVTKLGTGGFTGHWGWQWAMEARGWHALDEGSRPEAGTLVAMPRQAWPQPVEVNCAHLVWEGEASPTFPWLPRGYSEQGRANLHANWIYGLPPVRTVVPWTFASDPYERVRVCSD